MTWAPENPVSLRARSAPRARNARSIREVLGARDLGGDQRALPVVRGRGGAPRSTRRTATSSTARPPRRRSSASAWCAARCCTTSRSTSSGSACCSSASARPRASSTCTTTRSRRGRGASSRSSQTALWLSLLRACSGFEAFMRRQQGRVSREAAVSFLLFEARFPRSLRYCVHSALALARAARRHEPQEGRPRRARPARRARPLARQPRSRTGSRSSVHALLTHVVDEASLACEELQQGVEGATAVAQPAAEGAPRSSAPVT